MNNVSLVGRLVRDVELRYIQSTGIAVGNMTIAVDREFNNKDGKKETDYIDVQVWGKSAENCANYIGKGSLVSVGGSLRIETYMKDDEKRKSAKVNATKVNFLSSNNNNVVNNNVEQFKPNFEQQFSPQSAFSDDDMPF